MKEFGMNTGGEWSNLCLDHAMELYKEKTGDSDAKFTLSMFNKGIREGVSWIFDLNAEVDCDKCGF